jgi:hypothetical protein
MRTNTRLILLAALLLAPAPSLLAQTAVDPSGHWEGVVHAPNMEVTIAVDLGRNGKGELAGTFDNPAQHLKGLPLSNVAVDGRSLTFQVKGSAPGERVFKGALAADGKTMSGDYAQGGLTMPFNLTRTGGPRIEAAASSAPIGKELEGAWHGTLDVNGIQRRLVLTMANHPDGTATGNFVNVEEGLEIPITTITQKASSVTLDVKTVGVSYTGALNPDGTELAGTLTQGSAVLPLTFQRTAAIEGKK